MSARRTGWAVAALAAALLGSCAPRPAPPAAPPTPPPAPPEPPPPPPAPLDWQDAPLSDGDWAYRETGDGSVATFGGQFAVRCLPARRIALSRAGAAGSALTVRTSDGARSLPAAIGPDGLAATLDAAHPLLDAMVFSRGRFAVEAAGAPLLILPAWPEPARVVEDCRG